MKRNTTRPLLVVPPGGSTLTKKGITVHTDTNMVNLVLELMDLVGS